MTKKISFVKVKTCLRKINCNKKNSKFKPYRKFPSNLRKTDFIGPREILNELQALMFSFQIGSREQIISIIAVAWHYLHKGDNLSN